MVDTNRRTTVSAVVTALLAGCTTVDDRKRAADSSESSETATKPNRPSNCALRHELVDDDSRGYEWENLTYQNLSPNAKYLFEKTVENHGYMTKNESRNPPEFDYSDTRTNYRIRRNNTTYTIITYSGSGC